MKIRDMKKARPLSTPWRPPTASEHSFLTRRDARPVLDLIVLWSFTTSKTYEELFLTVTKEIYIIILSKSRQGDGNAI